ncbi:hypothetical protein QUA13_13170 [Microcoleus sp. S28C3]
MNENYRGLEFTYSCILVGNWYQLAIISFPVPPELYRGDGTAVSLPELIVGTRHCRLQVCG